MAKKKKFTRGLNALLPDDNIEDQSVKSEEMKERELSNERKKSQQKRAKLEKISFNLDKTVSETVKAYAFKKRVSITNILEECIEEFFSKISNEEIQSAQKIYREKNG